MGKSFTFFSCVWIFASFCLFEALSINTPPHVLVDREWILTEDEVIGSVVARIQVQDLDGDQVNITLGSPSSSVEKKFDGFTYFKIDSNYRVKLAKSLEGLAGQKFLVGVIATDGTLRSRVDTRVIIRRHDDVIKPITSGLANSFDPGPPPPIADISKFSPSSGPPMLLLDPNTVWTVTDNLTKGTFLNKVTAHDLSETSLNFSVFPEDLIKIDEKNGDVTIAKSLRDEVGTHKLTIKVANQFSSITENVTLEVIRSDPSEEDNDEQNWKEKEKRKKEEKERKKEEKERKEEEKERKEEEKERKDEHDSDQPSITVIKNGSETPSAAGTESALGYTVILLIIIFGVLSLMVVGFLFFRRYRRKQKEKAEAKESSVSYTEKRNSRSESLVSGLFNMVGFQRRAENNGYEDTSKIPRVPSRESNKCRKSSKSSLTPAPGADEWEVSRHKLKILGILGEGCFGQVWKCEAKDLKVEGLSLVAVKTIKEGAGTDEQKDLVQELKVLKSLGYHPNVVSLLGCCTEKEPIFVILEYMIGGKLQSYLRASRADGSYNNLHGVSGTLNPKDLTIFALQIAKGMDFLSRHGIIHRDLAARNILVGEDKICKVADFGFARDVANNHVYQRKSNGRLPIRWMALESLYDNIFTTKSDVWSFGILLWEIVTLGSTPYPGMVPQDVIRKVNEGYRLEKPSHCRREIYNIMFYCWSKDPSQRPKFEELVHTLESLISTEVEYIQLDNFPDHNYYNFSSGTTTGELL